MIGFRDVTGRTKHTVLWDEEVILKEAEVGRHAEDAGQHLSE